MDDIEKEYLRLKGRFPVLFSIKGTTIQTETDGTPKPIKPIAGARITGRGMHFDKIKSDLIEVAEKNPDFKLIIRENIRHYDRSTIQEVPILANVVIVHQRPRRAPVTDAEQLQRDHIQDSGYTHRFSMRRLK